jgi:hypothetical protein
VNGIVYASEVSAMELPAQNTPAGQRDLAIILHYL